MTNPSHEYMRRIRREEQDKLLDIRREQAMKSLEGLDLHGDSHAMLSQIAYAIHPHVGAWDAESCDHLRNVLIELIGGDHEAASDAQRHCACGAGDCDCVDEQKEVGDGMARGGRGMREDSGDSACERMGYSDIHQEVVGLQYDVLSNEQHKAVCELRELGKCSPLACNFREAIAAAVAVPKDGAPYDDGELCHLICDRLIHLIGGDLSHDTSPMRQENETENPCTERYVLEHPRMIGEPDGITITNGKHEVRIVKDDVIADDVSVMDIVNETINKELGGQSRTCPESKPDVSESDDGMSITKELRNWINDNENTITVYTTMPPQVEEEPTRKGEELLAIADKIDAQFARVCEQQERVLQDTIDEMSEERDKARREIVELRKNRYELQRKCGVLKARLDELEKFDPEIAIAIFGDDNAELRKLLSRAAKLLADAERDRDENYHLWMDCKQKVLQSNITVGELTDERDELNKQLERRKAKCLRYKTHIDQMQGGSKQLRKELCEQEGMYLDLLRDAAHDYKALKDKLCHVVEVCQSYTEAKCA